MKHLFHGSRGTDPHLIYGSEDGLDIRFSNAGAYGNGIYFANNSQYSSGYAYQEAGGNGKVFKMFVCLVLVGDSVQVQGGQYRLPPNKPGS
jgi:Poly(ADP-ribose) polymerase catalytic domain